MFPLLNVRVLVGAFVGLVAVVAGILSPVRGHWDVTLAGVPGASPVAHPVTLPVMVLTGFQAPPAVRRGPEQLRLAPGTRIDLDSRAAGWNAGDCAERCDLAVSDRGAVEEIGGGELADKSAAYHSCLAASEYGFAILPDPGPAGVQACGRTSDGRPAGITVTRPGPGGDHAAPVVLSVIVWEVPPVTVLRTDEEDPPLFQDLPGE